ncbi:MAG TPA: HAD family phosphatase, partial [Salinimicrobium sp.]|nr:HAD family phosphatase [Salinimicrobium sp.]
SESLNHEYEKGKLTSEEFVEAYKKILPNISGEEIKRAWNSMLLDLPENRLDFLRKLAAEKKFKLFLLSNTNKIHMDWVAANIAEFQVFKDCFDGFYLSYEMGIRKPNPKIYEWVLNDQNLKADECIFVDDKSENTASASKVGLHTWNLKPGQEDVTQLFEIKKELF